MDLNMVLEKLRLCIVGKWLFKLNVMSLIMLIATRIAIACLKGNIIRFTLLEGIIVYMSVGTQTYRYLNFNHSLASKK